MQSSSRAPQAHTSIADIIRAHKLVWTSDRGIVCRFPCKWKAVNELFAHDEWAEHVAEVIEAAGAVG